MRKSQYVSVAHRYWDERWDDAENHLRYGSLASRDGIGSNMRVELGRFNAKPAELDAASTQVKQLLDHRCLFAEVPEFKASASTLERICAYLQSHLPPMDFIRVEENSKRACQIDAQGMTLELHVMNLGLYFRGPLRDDGLIFEREQVTQAVINEYRTGTLTEDQSPSNWARLFYEKLLRQLPLSELRIDLGRQRYILVKSNG